MERWADEQQEVRIAGVCLDENGVVGVKDGAGAAQRRRHVEEVREEGGRPEAAVGIDDRGCDHQRTRAGERLPTGVKKP